MKPFIKVIIGILIVFIPGCEDKNDEPNRPDELVGIWDLSETDASLLIGSKIAQTGADIFSKGESSIQVTGTPNAELAYMFVIPPEEGEGDGPEIILTNRSLIEMDSETGPELPIFSLMVGEESPQEKFAFLSVQISETDGGFYANMSDFVLDESNFSLTMTKDTLFSIDFNTGEMDPTKYFVVDGTFKASTIPFAASDSNEVAFPMLGADLMNGNMSITMEKDGVVTTVFTDEEGLTETDIGEWYATDNNVLVAIFEFEDGEIDTMAMPYSFSGSQLQLTVYGDFCEEFEEDAPLSKRFRLKLSEPCYGFIEQMYLLEPNSVTSAISKIKMSFIQAIAKQRTRVEWEPPSNANWVKAKRILLNK
ncbi:MAG: hypothetical protein ISR82_05825 [Candidatus Marinimicrobia bacterium]|nr:hypothetical protein [Candidatus Neomarinimicrobiota bacterium]MBL7010722.1 hypothetical protein [Candidatus Neomarinimicrobiota bacterium]MBL7029889.1 hypothetical protein [Candidatus Neomarinimicrobiota bacterium]